MTDDLFRTDVPSGESYDYVGLVMQRTEEGEAMVRVFRDKPGIEIHEAPSFFEIRAKDRLVVNFDEVGEELGIEVDGYWLQTQLSTVFGRLIVRDDSYLLVADPRELVAEVDAPLNVEPQ